MVNIITIRLFDFEEGSTYVIKVKKEKVYEGEIPADTSLFNDNFIEIISKEPQN